MWKNIKYYVIALVIIYLGAVVSTGFQMLETVFPEIHPLSKLAANLAGVSVGGFIMVLAFLRDNRVDEAREREHEERKRADQAIQRAERATLRAERAEAELERAEAELERMRSEFQPDVVLDRIRRLEEINGISGGGANGNGAAADGGGRASKGE